MDNVTFPEERMVKLCGNNLIISLKKNSETVLIRWVIGILASLDIGKMSSDLNPFALNFQDQQDPNVRCIKSRLNICGDSL